LYERFIMRDDLSTATVIHVPDDRLLESTVHTECMMYSQIQNCELNDIHVSFYRS